MVFTSNHFQELKFGTILSILHLSDCLTASHYQMGSHEYFPDISLFNGLAQTDYETSTVWGLAACDMMQVTM